MIEKSLQLTKKYMMVSYSCLMIGLSNVKKNTHKVVLLVFGKCIRTDHHLTLE